MNKEKDFDSVQMMREIREWLSEKYYNNPQLLKEELEKVRNKSLLFKSAISK